MNGDSLDGEELVIRRFDPSNPHHYTSDDAGLPSRLRQSSLRFDREGDVFGCSVFQDSELRDLGLRRTDCIEADKPHWEIAAATANAVRSVIRDTLPLEPNPFDVVEDRFPDGSPPSHARDGAHALIIHAPDLRGAEKWYQRAASVFTVGAARS